MTKYNCKKCNAELYWDEASQSLKCEYCESSYQPSDFEEQVDEKVIESTELEEDRKATDISDSADLVVYKCQHCGAEIVTARSTVATKCAYCDRAVTLTNKIVKGFNPEQVIPFIIDKNKAQELYKNYYKSTKFTPKNFVSENIIKEIKGIYVPFWLNSFDIDFNSLVKCTEVDSSRKGDDKVITTKKYDVYLDGNMNFKDIPTDALKNITNDLADAVSPFDYSKLKDFDPAYMAGFYAEENNENKDEGLVRAKNYAEKALSQDIISSAGMYDSKTISELNCRYSNIKNKLVMLPIWLLNVEYKNKRYTYAINGESGKVVGKLPLSIPKVGIASFIASALTAFIVYIIFIFLEGGLTL